jgi:adenylate kinase
MSSSKSLLSKPIRGLFLGTPGAGKGTQTSRVLIDFPHISAVSSGDLLRNNIRQRTQIGLEAQSIIQRGGLIPDASIISLIEDELESRNWLSIHSSWLLDGFPRTASQAKPLDKLLDKHSIPLNFVVELNVPEDVILDRIENRFVHEPSGRVYNLTFNPPIVPGKDDVTGEPLTKRPDDNAAVFKKRLDNYHELTTPLLEYYDKRGILHSIEGNTSDIIYPKLKKLLIDLFK